LDPRALRILVVDDEEHIRFAISMCLETDGHKVVAVGTIDAALEATARQAFDLIFLDVRLGTQNGLDYIKTLLHENPWARIVVITAYASIATAVEAMKLGASDYLAKPFEPVQLTLLTQKVAEKRLLERKVDALQKTLGALDPESDFPTSSPVWRESIELARRIAPTSAPVLIRGEPGTGKGRLARTIHEWSARSQGPFAAVSLGDRSVDALEEELFGAGPEIGGKVGAIAFCHGGTLLLDEISQLPMRLQPRLLSLLREKEFERQDEFLRRTVDVRVIATSGTDLSRAVQAGQFREDLLMALSVTQLDIPSLRERPEDILMLADRYLAYYAREHHRNISGLNRDAVYVLKTHLWPGNVRELRNVIERAVLLCDSDLISLDHLPPDLMNAAGNGESGKVGGYQVGDLVPLEVIEELHIRRVLASAKTLRRAAAVLGVNASALCRKLKRLDLENPSDDKPAQ
jgi:NtrC-family two-component system response regulator AlgB